MLFVGGRADHRSLSRIIAIIGLYIWQQKDGSRFRWGEAAFKEHLSSEPVHSSVARAETRDATVSEVRPGLGY